MNKKSLKLIVIGLFVILMLPLNSFAAPKRVRVALPSYPIIVNGVTVNNAYREYPFIVYKGITYLPLTYYDSRALGFETVLTSELTLDQTGICGGYRDFERKQKNKNSYTATLASFPIKINGKTINNYQQKYPILMIREMAYLPITTDIAKNKLGINYEFNKTNGLRLNSSGVQVKEIKLPIALDKPFEWFGMSNFMIAKGYCYYTSKKGEVYQIGINKPIRAKKVYQLPLYSEGVITDDKEAYVSAFYTQENGDAVLNYHHGSAALGEDYKIQLNPNGTTKEKENNRFTMAKYTGDVRLRIGNFDPITGNISIQYKGGKSEGIGDERYLYGHEWKKPKEGEPQYGTGDSNDAMYIYNNKVYVLACNFEDPKAVTGVHSIDLKTHETLPVTVGEVFNFKMDEDRLYYYQENQMYVQSVNSQETQKVAIRPQNKAVDFDVLGGCIYYKDQKTGALYRCYENEKNEPVNPGAKVIGIKRENDYIVATFKEEKNAKYRMMVFDKLGKVIIKSADTPFINNIIIDNKQFSYMDKNTRIYYASLK